MKKNKIIPLTPVQKMIEDTYLEDIQTLIDANKSDLNNWVNIDYHGVLIPMTKQEQTIWDNPRLMGRKDKRAMASDIKNQVSTGTAEYFRAGGIVLMRRTDPRENDATITIDERAEIKKNAILQTLKSLFKK